MKQTIILAAMLLASIGISAQDWDFGGGYETNRHNFGVEIGLGGTGDVTVDVGAKWQMNLHEYVAWDVVTAKAMADVEHNFSKSLTGELLTGVRGISPDFAGLTAYATIKGGYAYNFDATDGGFAYELGLGVNITRTIYVGYAYNGYKIDRAKVNYHALRWGFLF